MRVGFLIDRWEPGRGGAEGALARLAEHLIERGFDVRAFGLSAAPDAPGRFHGVRAGGLTRARREERLGHALVEAAREAGCERTIGIRHLPEVDLYWPHGGSHQRSLAARRRRGGSQPHGRHRVFVAFERRLLDDGGARRIACVSRLVLGELAELHPRCRDRLVLVPNGVDLDRFRIEGRSTRGGELRRSMGVAEGTPLLAFAARDPRLKGLPELCRALAGLDRRRWVLLVAGARHPQRWERIARRLGVPRDRLVVRGQVDPRCLHAAADLTVLPTWRDTSSFVVLESLATGTPVLTTIHAGAAEAIRSDDQGEVLADPGDLPALRDALERWIARVSGAAIDRERVRDAVRDRGLGPWLERLERLVVEPGPGADPGVPIHP